MGLSIMCFIYFWLGFGVKTLLTKLFKECRYRQYLKTAYGTTCFCINKKCPNDFCPYENKTDRKCGYYD